MATQTALQSRLSGDTFADPESFVANDATARIYNTSFCKLAGGMTAGVFLSRVIYYWRNNNNQPFWKMNTPDGDPERSWTEQEGFTENELNTARARVGTRVQKPAVSEMSVITPNMLDKTYEHQVRKVKGEMTSRQIDRGYRGLSRCVLYWRNGSGRIWYRVNEALVAALLMKDADPTRDNIEILREVKRSYPNAVIQGIDDEEGGTQAQPVAPEPPPAPKKTIPMQPIVTSPPTQPALVSDAAPPAPKAKKPKPTAAEKPATEKGAPKKRNPYKVAIAYSYGWLNDDGSPNDSAPMIGQILSQFVGNASKGRRAEYKIGDFNPEMILGMFLWYRAKNQRMGNDKLQHLPQTAETLKERADEFLSIMEVERAHYIKQGEALLANLMSKESASPNTGDVKLGKRFDFEAANQARKARERAEREQRLALNLMPVHGAKTHV